MSADFDLYKVSGMDPQRIVVCWITRDGSRGTTHSAPVTVRDAIIPALAGEYVPAAMPQPGAGTWFFDVDHEEPNANQILTDHGGDSGRFSPAAAQQK